MTATFDELSMILANTFSYSPELQNLVIFLCEAGEKEIQDKFGIDWSLTAKRGQSHREVPSLAYTYLSYFAEVHHRLDHTEKYHLKCFSKPFLALLEFVKMRCQLALAEADKKNGWPFQDKNALRPLVENPRDKKLLKKHYPKLSELGFLK